MKSKFKLIFTILLMSFSALCVKANTLEEDNTEAKIRDFILNNPEIILESLKRYEEQIAIRAKETEIQVIKKELLLLGKKKSDFIGGNPDGQITIIEFLDYRCGYCKKIHNEIGVLLTRNPELRFVVKEFPILGEQSVLAAKANIAILMNYGSSVYEQFGEKLFEYNGVINNDTITRILKTIGTDPKIITSIMESERVYNILNANYLLAKQLNINGTPTFIIGTEIIRGYKDVDALQKIINVAKQAL